MLLLMGGRKKRSFSVNQPTTYPTYHMEIHGVSLPLRQVGTDGSCTNPSELLVDRIWAKIIERHLWYIFSAPAIIGICVTPPIYILYIYIYVCIYIIYMYVYIYISDWWFGTCFIFPYIGNNHPNWLVCFRGVKTPTRIYLYIYYKLVSSPI